MEAYSASMAEHVRDAFRLASPARLAELTTYYLKRQGPGLALLKLEYQARGLPFPPACPVCGQQRNRCVCPPWLQPRTARVATAPN